MKKITVDVAVVGAGVAGVTSAVSVGEKGYSVALFEASNGFGAAVRSFDEAERKTDGTPFLGGVNGIFAVETEFQNSRHYTTTRKDVYDYLLDHAHWAVDPRIIAEFVNRSNEVYEWLAKDGLKIETAVSYYKDAPFTWLFFDTTGPRLPEILVGHFRALENCTLYSNVEINEIIMKDGCVCGLKGTGADGEEIEVTAKAVVIATGEPGGIGPMSDVALDRALNSIEMAVKLGAARGRDTLSGMAVPDGYHMMDALGTTRQPTQLIVNQDGERFTNEEVLRYLEETALNFANQKDGIVFTIFDESINRYHEEHGWFYFFYGRGPQRPENARGLFEEGIADGADCLFLAETIEELAGKMGLDPVTLRKTVDEYNAICLSGRDPLMKDVRFLMPLTTPPFYGTRMKADIKKMPGVLRPNHRCQVLNTRLDPIPGLFAAGGACSLLNGEIFTRRVAGNRATYALVSGRIIGESVPEYIEQNF
jgi:fumarate reductase flavoprotein subunit